MRNAKDYFGEMGYKLIKTGYCDDKEEFQKLKNYYKNNNIDAQIIRIKCEVETLIKYEIYIKNIENKKSLKQKYCVRWYDKYERKGIWEGDSIQDVLEQLTKLNIKPLYLQEVE